MESQIWIKIVGIAYRISGFFRSFPIRIIRIFKHLWKGFMAMDPRRLQSRRSSNRTSLIHDIGSWCIDLFFYLLDAVGVPECYETLTDIIKFNARPLRESEIRLAQSVFGNSIDYRRVRIDEYSFAGPKQKMFCYVSFYVINSWGPMQDSTFIHEMTHVWQFEKLGSIYIPHALRAQYSMMGYNYGGVDALKASQEKGKSFLSFNFEQQGDIISDYYRIKTGYKPHWGNGRPHDLPVYESFVEQMRAL